MLSMLGTLLWQRNDIRAFLLARDEVEFIGRCLGKEFILLDHLVFLLFYTNHINEL